MSDVGDLLKQLLGTDLAHVGEDASGVGARRLGESGLLEVGVSERLGGSGGELADAAAVVTGAAEAGVSLPTVERLFGLAVLAAATGQPLPAGSATLAVVQDAEVDEVADGATGGRRARVCGAATGVGWGSASETVWLVVPAGAGRVAVVISTDADGLAWDRAASIAGEPCDDLTVDLMVDLDQAWPLPRWGSEALAYAMALGRACQLLGALRSALRLTRDYVGVRHQFGASLASHQVVRHAVASLVCEVAAAEAAVAHAVSTTSGWDGPVDTTARLAIAAAKTQTSQCATTVARVAHQLHGAIGVTAEHPLHTFTTGLWAWRDQDGSAEFWCAQALDIVRDSYGGDLWAALTAQPSVRQASTAQPLLGQEPTGAQRTDA